MLLLAFTHITQKIYGLYDPIVCDMPSICIQGVLQSSTYYKQICAHTRSKKQKWWIEKWRHHISFLIYIYIYVHTI